MKKENSEKDATGFYKKSSLSGMVDSNKHSLALTTVMHMKGTRVSC